MNGQEAFDPISAGDRASRPWRQRRKLRPARAELVGDLVPDVACRLPIGLDEGSADRGGDDGVLATRHVGQRVAHEVDAAALSHEWPGGHSSDLCKRQGQQALEGSRR